jgi:hypothetical protein
MCKHVAAVLYGIGARLDRQPELLFRLHKLDERNSSAAPVEGFFSQRKEEIPGKFCLPAIFLISSDWISLKAAHSPPHCLQLAQVRTRVRRKREGTNRLSVPAGDSGRHKPSADVCSLFSLLLLACSEQLAQESPGRNNNGPMDAEAVRRLIGEALGDHAMQQGASPAGACAERPAI